MKLTFFFSNQPRVFNKETCYLHTSSSYAWMSMHNAYINRLSIINLGLTLRLLLKLKKFLVCSLLMIVCFFVRPHPKHVIILKICSMNFLVAWDNLLIFISQLWDSLKILHLQICNSCQFV